MTWQVVVVLSLLIAASVVVIVLAFAALARALDDSVTGGQATIHSLIEGQAAERAAALATVEMLLVSAADDRQAFLRAVIGRHAGEVVQLVHADNAPAVAREHTRFAQSLDPRMDDLVDPDTHEAISLAGMGSG